MCFVFIWEQTATCATYSINWLVFITEMKRVYCAVRTGSLNKAVCASSLKGWIWFLFLLSIKWNWHWVSSVTVVTKLGLYSRWIYFDCRQYREVFPAPNLRVRLWGPTSLLCNGYRGLFTQGQTTGSWNWSLNPASAHFKNGWSCASSLCAFVAYTLVTLRLSN